MIFREYSVSIPEGKENSDGYVFLKNKQKYTLRLENNSYQRCCAIVSIDGKQQGAWVINGGDSIVLERSFHSSRYFVFYPSTNNSESGLLKVLFVPEKEQSSPSDNDDFSLSESFSFSASFKITEARIFSMFKLWLAVGPFKFFELVSRYLSDFSSQEFSKPEPIELYKYQGVTIHLRLVSDRGNEVKSIGNPVPPPLR